MIKVERDKVAFYQFLGLRDFPGLSHFVSGREGGVSVGRQTALNLGFMDEDRDERVLVNRMLLAEAIGCGVDDFTLGEQKHTTHVEVVDRVQRGRGGRGKATRLPSTDALITKETGTCGRLCPSFNVRFPNAGDCCCPCRVARYCGKNCRKDSGTDARGVRM